MVSNRNWVGMRSISPLLCICVCVCVCVRARIRLSICMSHSDLTCTLERELEDDPQLESELYYRKFIIFPQGNTIRVKRRTEVLRIALCPLIRREHPRMRA